jgi:hypothetical protein
MKKSLPDEEEFRDVQKPTRSIGFWGALLCRSIGEESMAELPNSWNPPHGRRQA